MLFTVQPGDTGTEKGVRLRVWSIGQGVLEDTYVGFHRSGEPDLDPKHNPYDGYPRNGTLILATLPKSERRNVV